VEATSIIGEATDAALDQATAWTAAQRRAGNRGITRFGGWLMTSAALRLA
jgi:hypothetical protein